MACLGFTLSVVPVPQTMAYLNVLLTPHIQQLQALASCQVGWCVFFFFFRYCQISYCLVLYTGFILPLSFPKSGGVDDRLHICPLCGIFYFPWHLGPTAFSVSSERQWQSGVNGIAQVPKRSCRSGIRTQDHLVASALTRVAERDHE